MSVVSREKTPPFIPRQAHGNRLITSEALSAHQNVADGVLIGADSPPGGVQTADCLPLVVASEENAVVLHVSRKTLVAGLLDHVAARLPPEKIAWGWIGPHICQEHFTFDWVGPDIEAFGKKFPAALVASPIVALSLQIAVESYFRSWGIPLRSIKYDTRCTFETPALPSYRRSLQEGSALATRLVTAVTRVS